MRRPACRRYALSKRKLACALQRPPCRAVYHPGQGGLGKNRRRVAPVCCPPAPRYSVSARHSETGSSASTRVRGGRVVFQAACFGVRQLAAAFKAQARLRTPKTVLQGGVHPGQGSPRLLCPPGSSIQRAGTPLGDRLFRVHPGAGRPRGVSSRVFWSAAVRRPACRRYALSKHKLACALQRPPCRAVYHPGQGSPVCCPPGSSIHRSGPSTGSRSPGAGSGTGTPLGDHSPQIHLSFGRSSSPAMMLWRNSSVTWATYTCGQPVRSERNTTSRPSLLMSGCECPNS